MIPANVTISGAVAAQVERQMGAACAGAVARLLRAVEHAGAQPAANMVLSDDLFSCFVMLPTLPGKGVRLRAYWHVDAATGQKIVVRVKPG